jgi:D-alanine-D-alanine ligase-like ATP-grasp enzyme
MKICVLHSAYDYSDSPFKQYDSPVRIEPHLAGHDFDVVGLHKATSVGEIQKLARRDYDVFINLCDGGSDEDRAGIEVVQTLEQLNVPFTGPASDFYDPTREDMKRVCRAAGIATPGYCFARGVAVVSEQAAGLRFPLIVKHPDGYGSIGMTRNSRVETSESLFAEVERLFSMFGGALIEEFIEGREFTVLVVEDAANPERPIVFEPLEFLFPPGENFKHYDLKWVDDTGLRSTPCADGVLSARMRWMSAQMFLGLKGSGYARCDIRVDADDNPYMLEINPNCGVFYAPEDAGGADLILLGEPDGHARFLKLLLDAARRRVRSS